MDLDENLRRWQWIKITDYLQEIIIITVLYLGKKKKYKENIEKFDFFWVASLYYISFKISETDGLLNNLAQVRTGISQYQSDILI